MTFGIFGDLPVLKPFGKALDWSDAEIEQLAEVTDSDVAAADAHWVQYAPQPYKSLLGAVER